MDKYTVLPTDDGHNMRGGWMVHKNGKMQGRPHTKKSAAKRKMRNMASDGDTIEVRKTNGQVQSGYPRTYQGGNSSSSEGNNGGGGRLPGMGTFKTGIGFD
jgi:hypothetical protein